MNGPGNRLLLGALVSAFLLAAIALSVPDLASATTTVPSVKSAAPSKSTPSSRSVPASAASLSASATTVTGSAGGGSVNDPSMEILLVIVVAFAGLGGAAIYATSKKAAREDEVASSSGSTFGAPEGSAAFGIAGPDGSREVTSALPAVLGRSSSSDIPILDPEVSGYHAKVVAAGQDKIEVIDLGSSNGTFVEGRQVDSAGVTTGGSFMIGSTIVTLVRMGGGGLGR